MCALYGGSWIRGGGGGGGRGEREIKSQVYARIVARMTQVLREEMLGSASTGPTVCWK